MEETMVSLPVLWLLWAAGGSLGLLLYLLGAGYTAGRCSRSKYFDEVGGPLTATFWPVVLPVLAVAWVVWKGVSKPVLWAYGKGERR